MDSKVIAEIKGYKIIEESWGLIHVENPPNDEELEKIYAEEYYSSDKPDYLSRYEEDKDWWKEVYNYRLNLLNRYNGRHKEIVDIGSGPGLLLEVAAMKGWQTTGYEPNKDAFNYSLKKGLNVFNEFFTGQLNEIEHIYLGEVLEHIQNPVKFMKTISQSMAKGGVIAIIVPNDLSLLHQILTDQFDFEKWFLAPPFHLNYFNVDSLKHIVEKVGLKTVHVETTFSIETMLLMGENYLKINDLGRKWHQRRMAWETRLLKDNPKLYEEYYTKMGAIGHGREIFLIAKK
jgi:2-polyprenyl-3-methyl-5-hydroxy-6-metoxy-1,4-benzoquinol methylase